ncbi:MAG: GNAT family N-acetyltransferase [Spirochaetaceae bacterium]|jgi:Leu/Phe-tRNA-protein transferase|nr:GNAT family N-acetyltransferase [Spirochaetaceae bacterium]
MELRYTASGEAIIAPTDDPEIVVDTLLSTAYAKEFCFAFSFEPDFIAALMKAGFLVMSIELMDDSYLLVPKIHLTRSIIFFDRLHIKKSIRRLLSSYELRFNSDFDTILDRCLAIHGSDWLTEPLVDSIRLIRADTQAAVKPVSFGVYRNGILRAGEFGIVAGGVYTSYSGYYDESNAGTVQLILTAQYLQTNNFAFFDLGMPMAYKDELGAENVTTETFVHLFRNGRDAQNSER